MSQVPENEQWLHEPAAKERLDEAIRWAEENPQASATDLDDLERRAKTARPDMNVRATRGRPVNRA